MVYTGKQIKLKRIALGLRQGVFAKQLGITPTMLCLIESGKENGLPSRVKATDFFEKLENKNDYKE